MNRAVKAACERVREAERQRDAIIETIYAVGDRIAYDHGQNVVLVDVVGTSGDRLKVRSLNNGREYWIRVYRVV